MKSRFQLPPGSPALPPKLVHFVSAPVSGDAITRPQVVTYLNSHATATKRAALKRLMQRLGSGRVAQGFLKTPPIRKSDPIFFFYSPIRNSKKGAKNRPDT